MDMISVFYRKIITQINNAEVNFNNDISMICFS
jgi:hypothetical protein